MRFFRGVVGIVCALAGAVSASAAPSQSAPIAEIPHTQPPASEAERLLVAHNAERTRLGLPALAWSQSLAREASDFAKVLASTGQLRHATAEERKGTGENLWIGTAGAWDAGAMVEMFLEERRYFRAAPFPDVSLTGRWKDAGHYSQIVWRETRQVGCAIESAKGLDVLVCRYHPAGNVIGEKPF